MEIIAGIVAFLGTVGLMGLFIFIMIQKYDWKIAQIVAGVVAGLLLAVNFPSLPPAVNNGLTSIVSSIK